MNEKATNNSRMYDNLPSKNNNSIKKGQKRAYVVTKLPVSPKDMDIESKACIFYRISVVKDRKYRFRTYRSVFVGKEMVDSMVVSGLAKNRDEAVQLGRFLAKKLNLFQNIENNIMNKTILFKDNANKYYRFSGGALRVIRNMEEDEKKDDQAASTKKKELPMQYKNAPRNTVEKSESTKNDNEVMDVSVFKKKTKNTPKALKKKTTTNNISSLPVMQSIVEEENEDEQTANSARNKELKRLEEIQKLARVQAAFEIEAGKLPEEEKGWAEKDRIQRLRLLAKEHLEFDRSSRKNICSVNVINEDGDEADDVAIVDAKERMMADIVNRLEANHPKDLVATYGSLMSEIDKKVSSIYTGDHNIVETQWGDIMENTSNEEEEAMVVAENSHSDKEEVEAKKEAKENPTEKKPILNNEPSKQEVSNAVESYNDDEETHKFVMSPKDLPTGFRKNDLKESFDTFESLLTENNYPSLQDDDQSAWTEYIIGDDEGREQYLLNEIKRGRSSYTSYVEISVYDDGEQSYMEYTVADDETRYDDETVFDEKTVVSQSEESFQSLMKATNGGDDQSMMAFNVFDNDSDTVQVSYVVDDINYVAPEEKENDFQEPAYIPSSPSAVKSLGPQQAAFTSLQDQMENNFPVIYANSNSMADDEVTVLTMDYSLIDYSNEDSRRSSFGNYSRPQPQWKKETKIGSAFMYPEQLTSENDKSVGSVTMKSCYSTSKKRIQEILWNDLHSCDMHVVCFAMEELRTIVVNEPASRKHIMRLGGVMAIMRTMEEYFEVEVIQYLCCVVIELLSAMEPDARKLVSEIYWIQLIVRSMQDQADSDRVQEAGRSALATVCRT